ncbi:non-ribosomal peptide synthetase [Actinospica robiniae]|uniref:non-ribosomal peptide synthetase n=1 Tax=Actinospica robiniae TaxID=304901 RepID=UPI000427F2BA|nr:non-ribosomal peptide synthetase [Actinospica robiniae]
MSRHPFSHAQRRLWFLHHFDPEDTAHNLYVSKRLSGELDTASLAAAFTDVQQRHASLRTRFIEADGVPLCEVEAVAAAGLELVDLSGLPEQAREAEAQRQVNDCTATAFDIAKQPPIRALLLRLGEREHVLCIAMHHLLADVWSLNILMSELSRCYLARCAGEIAQLPELAATYGDHCVLEDERELDPAKLDHAVHALDGIQPLSLPTDRPRPPIRGTAGDEQLVWIEPDTVESVHQLARASRCTPFVVLLSAYQVLLSRWSGQSDLVVGTATAGRLHPDFEPVVGLFAGTLALRADLADDPTFSALLARTRRSVLLALSHQDVPFERIVAALPTAPDPSRTPVFQASLTLHSHAVGYGEPTGFADLAASLFPPGRRHATTDLSLDVWSGPEGMEAVFAYTTDLFNADTIARLARSFQTLLAGLVEDPSIRISRAPLLDPDEARETVLAWNDTTRSVPAATVVDMIAAQARVRPDDLAVGCGPDQLTYARLAASAGALAARLEKLGAGPGSIVAVCLDRSPALATALLGVLGSGAAYLPIDPDYPAARTAYVLEDSQAQLVITSSELRHLLPEWTTPVILDAAEEPTFDVPHAMRVPEPGDPAYVIYTSGSTGSPKGVVVPHDSLANFLAGMSDLIDTGPGDVWLALTSLSFDISGLELYLPLVAGARVEIADRATARDGLALARLVESAGVTHLQATPSGWRMLLAGDVDARAITALVGGEALPPRLAAELRAQTRRLVNMYGPTETTIWSTAWEVPLDPRETLIGSPIANTSVYVLDPQGRLLPIGVVGELVIGGAGLALGYLGRPGLTADRFVPDPYGPAGARAYRTGDQVRWRPDGRLEYVGRTDDQIKLRGHRIELGEVEAVLGAFPGATQTAVAVHNEVLVAYVVGSVDGLREHAAASLPSYMVPTRYVQLPALPLTPNGKVNRKALPAPTPRRSVAGAGTPSAPGAPRPPMTAEQAIVAASFRDVLGCGEVEIDDDFFALGGHSLAAVQAVARICSAVGGAIPVKELFLAPTIEAFARVVSERRASAPGLAPVRPRPAGAFVPVSAAQQRLWFLQRLDPQDASYTMYLVKRLSGPLDPAAFEDAWSDVVHRHESLRSSFPEKDAEPVLEVAEPGHSRIDFLDLSGLGGTAECEALSAVAAETNRAFDLTAEPPVRCRLLRLAEDDHVVCVTMHHAIADGASLNILLSELAGCYTARRCGTLPPPAPAISHPDVLWWRAQQADDGERAYWSEKLADPPILELPTDRPRPAASAHRGAFHGLDISPEPLARLLEVARSRGATLYMLLLAAYQVLLARHTGQDDLIVASPIAGRERVEFESVIGYFANTLVLRGDLSGDPRFTELLERTRLTVLEAFEHQDIPFEHLVADSRRAPLFRSMMILHTQDTPQRDDLFADLHMSPFDGGYRQAKLDLTLEAWQSGTGLSLLFGYDTELFDEATIAALAGHFRLLLDSIIEDPSQRIHTLPMSPEPEIAQLLTWADGPADEDTELVPDMLAAVPGSSVALVCGAATMTRSVLDDRVAQLATLLRRHGVGAKGVVGLCLERSVDSVAAILAVWAVGCAYLPLDSGYPAERLASLLEDSGAEIVLTDNGSRGALPPGAFTVLCCDDADEHDATGPHITGPDDDAYLIYTSGSTGQPKGVVVSHANLAARVRWMRRGYELGPGDVVVQFASSSFDTHAEEIFPALASGATVALLPGGPHSLAEFLATDEGRRVSVLDLPTAYWHALVDDLDQIRWPVALRLVILGGEQVHGAAVARWRARFGDRIRLVNTYGPTETTIIATADDIRDEDNPPIGHPISATAVYVLDQAGSLAPLGAPGELVVAGAGVARGYLGDPDATAARFIADPFGPPGSRAYRTGDRVRWRRDGRLEFLGRIDDQVKVWGFRVEPGEVEACLLTHPEVSGAVVVATGETLTAYVVSRTAPDALRQHAARILPPHLVPDRWIGIEEIPLTVNGKVDRKALPQPGSQPATGFTEPRTPAEELVAEVWAELLERRVGAHDDFFTLGGHSLLATRATARIRATTEIDIPLRTLFERRTVAEYAEALDELLDAEIAALDDEDVMRLLDPREAS